MTDQLPRLALKRRLEDIITDELGFNLVPAFTVEITEDVQVVIESTYETYQKIDLNSSALKATVTFEVIAFSMNKEKQVHDAILQLLNLKPSDFRNAIPFKVTAVTPTNAITSYLDEASKGHIVAGLTFDLDYIYRRD